MLMVMPSRAEVGEGVHVGVGGRVPHDHLRVDVEGSDHRLQRRVGPRQDLAVGGAERQRDVVVAVDHGLEVGTDGRAARADLDVHPGGLTVRVERAGHHLVLGVDRVPGPDQVVGGAVLRLGEPVGLDDDVGRAHVRQVDGGAARCAARGGGARRRRASGLGARCRGTRRFGRRGLGTHRVSAHRLAARGRGRRRTRCRAERRHDEASADGEQHDCAGGGLLHGVSLVGWCDLGFVSACARRQTRTR